MKRRTFLSTLCAVAVAPFVPVPHVQFWPLPPAAPTSFLVVSGAEAFEFQERYIRPAIKHLMDQNEQRMIAEFRAAGMI